QASAAVNLKSDSELMTTPEMNGVFGIGTRGGKIGQNKVQTATTYKEGKSYWSAGATVLCCSRAVFDASWIPHQQFLPFAVCHELPARGPIRLEMWIR